MLELGIPLNVRMHGADERGDDLDQALFQWLKAAAETTTNDANIPSVARNPMGQGCKAIIAPYVIVQG